MRTLILSIWISVILLPFSGCTHDDKELLAFYLSQPRDSKLIGKWQFLADPSMFQIYNEDGYIYNYSDGDINPEGSQGDCWFTEGDSVLRRYIYTGSRFTLSKELPVHTIDHHRGCLSAAVSPTEKVQSEHSRDQ